MVIEDIVTRIKKKSNYNENCARDMYLNVCVFSMHFELPETAQK